MDPAWLEQVARPSGLPGPTALLSVERPVSSVARGLSPRLSPAPSPEQRGPRCPHCPQSTSPRSPGWSVPTSPRSWGVSPAPPLASAGFLLSHWTVTEQLPARVGKDLLMTVPFTRGTLSGNGQPRHPTPERERLTCVWSPRDPPHKDGLCVGHLCHPSPACPQGDVWYHQASHVHCVAFPSVSVLSPPGGRQLRGWSA